MSVLLNIKQCKSVIKMILQIYLVDKNIYCSIVPYILGKLQWCFSASLNMNMSVWKTQFLIL